MEWAQPHQLSQRRQRYFIGKMLFDKLRQLFLMPSGEPSAHARRRRCPTVVHLRELVRQGNTERFHIGPLRSAWMLQLTVVFDPCGSGCELGLTHETKPESAQQSYRDWDKVLQRLAAIVSQTGRNAA